MYHHDPNQYPLMPCMPCQIYPIPFMPAYVMMAHAYVPYQCYMNSYPLNEAIMKGTIFPELYQPYVEKDKCKEGAL